MQRFFLSLLILTIGCFPGCSVFDFVGAYFNTYYNASKLFTEAENEILNAPARLTTSAERPFLSPFDIQPQTKTKLATVIEKCSKLLQYHPDSKLVDDALFMIGKSYYYQNDHQSAERKFKELLETFPESDLALETRLLLANTYYRNNDKPAAVAAARALLDDARNENEEGIASRAAFLLAHVESEDKNYEAAIAHFKEAGELADTDTEQADAFRLEGQLYELTGNYRGAAEAYLRSEGASSDHFRIARAALGQARMLSKLEQYEQSLDLLENLIENSNFREFFGDIDLEIANVYRDQKDYESAEAQYRYVDTAYVRTEASAKSYYQRGLLYEYVYKNFDSARVAYEKGRGEAPPSTEVAPLLARRSEYMNRYFALKKEITRNDSIKHFILNPPDTTTTKQSDTTGVEMAKQDTTVSDSTLEGALAKRDTLPAAPAIPPPPLDTVNARLALNVSEIAGLFYNSMELSDSAKYWYHHLLREYPASPYVARALYTLIQIDRADSGYTQLHIDSLYREILDRFPESEFASESRRHFGLPPLTKVADPLEEQYTKAESFVQQGDYATALTAFMDIIRSDSSSLYAAQAQYSIGWIYENVKNNNDSSAAHYQRLVRRFPNSEFSSVVQHKLAEFAMQKQRDLQNEKAKKDSVSAAPVQGAPPAPAGKEAVKTVPAKPDSVIDESSIKQPMPQSQSDELPEQ